MVIVFIVVPKNAGLQKYKEIALTLLTNTKNILEVRGEDIPSWVCEYSAQNKPVLGLVGEDLYSEFKLRKRNTLKVLRRISWIDKAALFGKPTLCLLGPLNKELKEFRNPVTVCISSKYTLLAKKYLNRYERTGVVFRKISMNGCIEACIQNKIADVVIDIVYTGTSIKKFQLQVYDQILQSDFLIIGGRVP